MLIALLAVQVLVQVNTSSAYHIGDRTRQLGLRSTILQSSKISFESSNRCDPFCGLDRRRRMPRGPRRVDEPLALLGGDPGDGAAAAAVDDAGAV